MEHLPHHTPEAESRANERQSYMFMVSKEQLDKAISLALAENLTPAETIRTALDEYIDRRMHDPVFIQRAMEEWGAMLPDEQPVTIKLARHCFAQLRHIGAIEQESRDQVFAAAIEEYYERRTGDAQFMEQVRRRLDGLAGGETQL